MTIQFEQYCAPILNVGGLSIDIVKTDSEGYARRYIEELEHLPHAILCGGGDGTLAEIVTGKIYMNSKNSTNICCLKLNWQSFQSKLRFIPTANIQ